MASEATLQGMTYILITNECDHLLRLSQLSQFWNTNNNITDIHSDDYALLCANQSYHT